MAVVNGYLTGQQAQDYIGRQYTDQFGILNDIVTAVSRQIDRHCGRHFYRDGTTGSPVARYFEVDDPCELELGVDFGRALLLELERVGMHLAGLAGLAADIGFLQGATTYGRLRTTAINSTIETYDEKNIQRGRKTMKSPTLEAIKVVRDTAYSSSFR